MRVSPRGPKVASSGDSGAEGKSRMRRLSNPGNVSSLDAPVAHGLQQAAFRSHPQSQSTLQYMSHKRGCMGFAGDVEGARAMHCKFGYESADQQKGERRMKDTV